MRNFMIIVYIAVIFLSFSVSCIVSGKNEDTSFDSARAFGYLEKQVSFGARVPGTEAHLKTSEWIRESLKQYTDNVGIQTFNGASGDSVVEMRNILASFYPEKKTRILLCAHWDSRPWADKDPDSTKHSEPVPGANDGASGVAVLLEMAAVIAKSEPEVGVDIVFFDGEDGGQYGSNDLWLLGSKYFAQTMPESFSPKAAILLDMIGDSSLDLVAEMNSINAAPELWGKAEKLCRELGITINATQMSVLDDHIPLIERGIPAIDFIDFNYPPWHTVSDTPDKCSAQSLGKIGTLVLKLVYGFKK